ncbi:MAG TPA: L,D-transpeptidase [Thermoanaerobaculia bacterium]|jgi:lipoprotein-anchoring transpeptidase ErfK/SrfK|nr:L,D-transpeptidase [Thermoanaerobaculia bacterium]
MCRKWFVAVLVLALAACTKEANETAKNVKESTKQAVKTVGDALEVNANYSPKPDDRAVREKERFDAQWRQLQYFRQQQAVKAAQQQQLQQQQQAAAQPATFRFVTGMKENWKVVDPNAINSAPVNAPVTGDVKGPSVLRAQVYLDRIHFSVGSLDGRWGRNSAITTWWYQSARGLPPTGDLDQQTFQRLAAEAGYAPVVKQYAVTADDLQGPFVSIPDSVYDQQKLTCLCYQTVREKLGEKFHSDPDFLDILNPDVKWSDLQAGTTLIVPNVRDEFTTDQKDFAKVVISIAGNSFNAFDASGRLLFHSPTTLGSGYDPSPSETVHVVKITPMPHFHYDPTLYHEVPDTDPDAHLAPGPNSPVGIVWIALSKEHYGIHGNPEPESIGYSSSHGCVRLTNWDAEEVEHRISEGVEVSFVDTRSTGMPAVAKKK